MSHFQPTGRSKKKNNLKERKKNLSLSSHLAQYFLILGDKQSRQIFILKIKTELVSVDIP